MPWIKQRNSDARAVLSQTAEEMAYRLREAPHFSQVLTASHKTRTVCYCSKHKTTTTLFLTITNPPSHAKITPSFEEEFKSKKGRVYA
jgi:tRNA G46 methylase TrmB